MTLTVGEMSAEDFLTAINNGARQRGNQTPGRAQTSPEDMTKMFTSLLGNIGAATQGIITKAGGRVSDVAGEFSGALSGMIGYVENTNDVFQSLSKVGAGFDGSEHN